MFRTKYMLILMGCLSVNVAYATCNLNNTPNIDGLRLGVMVKKLIKHHPTLRYAPDDGNKRKGRLDFPYDKKGEFKGVAGVWHIATLDNTVYSYSVFYDDKDANYETPLTALKNTLVKRYSLPSEGWKKSGKDGLKLRCGDIELTIRQDFGDGRGSTGAVLSGRYIPMDKIADSLK